MNYTWVRFHIDTASQATILTKRDFESIEPKPELGSRQVKLKAYNGKHIPALGACRV